MLRLLLAAGTRDLVSCRTVTSTRCRRTVTRTCWWSATCSARTPTSTASKRPHRPARERHELTSSSRVSLYWRHLGCVHIDTSASTSPSPGVRLSLVQTSPVRVELSRSLVQAHNSTRNRIEWMPCRKVTIFYYNVNNFTNRAPLITNNLKMTIYDVKCASWLV